MADTTHEPTGGNAAWRGAARKDINARDNTMAGGLVDGLQDARTAELKEAKSLSPSSSPHTKPAVLAGFSDQLRLTESDRTEYGGQQPVPEHGKHQKTKLSTLPLPGTSDARLRGQNDSRSWGGEEGNHETYGVVEQGAPLFQKQMQLKAQRSEEASKQMAYDVFDWAVGSVEILERYQDEKTWNAEGMRLSPTSKEMLDTWSKGETQVTAEVVSNNTTMEKQTLMILLKFLCETKAVCLCYRQVLFFHYNYAA